MRQAQTIELLSPEMISADIVENTGSDIVEAGDENGKEEREERRTLPANLMDDNFLLIPAVDGMDDDDISSGAISEGYNDSMSAHSESYYRESVRRSPEIPSDEEPYEQEDDDIEVTWVRKEESHDKLVEKFKQVKSMLVKEEKELGDLLEEIDEEQYHAAQLVRKDAEMQAQFVDLMAQIQENQGKIMGSQSRISNLYQSCVERRNTQFARRIELNTIDKELASLDIPSRDIQCDYLIGLENDMREPADNEGFDPFQEDEGSIVACKQETICLCNPVRDN